MDHQDTPFTVWFWKSRTWVCQCNMNSIQGKCTVKLFYILKLDALSSYHFTVLVSSLNHDTYKIQSNQKYTVYRRNNKLILACCRITVQNSKQIHVVVTSDSKIIHQAFYIEKGLDSVICPIIFTFTLAKTDSL